MNYDLISRSALKEVLEKYYEDKITHSVRFGKSIFPDIIALIDNAPTVEAVPISDYQKRALELADNLKDKGVINNRERGTLRRAILLEPERPKGEWIKADNLYDTVVCNKCGGIRRDNRIDHIAFCNKCGADMRGEIND